MSSNQFIFHLQPTGRSYSDNNSITQFYRKVLTDLHCIAISFHVKILNYQYFDLYSIYSNLLNTFFDILFNQLKLKSYKQELVQIETIKKRVAKKPKIKSGLTLETHFFYSILLKLFIFI